MQKPIFDLFLNVLYVFILNFVDLLVVHHFCHHSRPLLYHTAQYTLHCVFLNSLKETLLHNFPTKLLHYPHAPNEVLHHLKLPPLRGLLP